MEQNREDWNELIVILQRHRATLENHKLKLEEDCEVEIDAIYGPGVGQAIIAYIE